MNPLRIKLRTIIIPYLYLFTGTVMAYMLLVWLADISHIAWNRHFGLLLSFWIPLLLPLVLVLAFMRNRLSVLYTGRAYTFYIFLAYCVLCLSLPPAGKFILSAPYKLHHIQHIDDINIKDPERFYIIEDYELKESFGVMLPSNNGKGMHLEMACYTVTPFKDKKGFAQYDIWNVATYKKQQKILGVSRERFNTIQRDFLDSVKKTDKKFSIQKGTYFEVLPEGFTRDNFLYTLFSVYNFSTDPILLRRVSAPFSERYIPHLLKFLLYSIAGLCIFIFTVLISKLQLNNLRRYYNQDEYWLYCEPENKIKQRTFLQFLVPDKNGLYITPILIILNVLYFFIIVLAGNSFYRLSVAEMQAYGGNSLQGLLSGQMWRLLFNSFLHNGFSHLFGNMLSFAVIGSVLEPYIGKRRFLVTYLACAVMGSVITLIWKIYAVSAGASVPIAGLYGFLLALLVFRKAHIRDRKILYIISFTSILQLILVFNQTNIDNGGHIGGFITGFVLCCVFIFIDHMNGDNKLMKRSLFK